MCRAFKKEVNGGHESHDPVETGSLLIFSYLCDLMPIRPSKVSELSALLATWHNLRSNPRGISPIGHLGDTSRQQPHQTMAGAHTGICVCYVMFLYSHNFVFVFLDSASATGGSPISPWQEHAPDLTIFCPVLATHKTRGRRHYKSPPPHQNTKALSPSTLIPPRHD